MAHLIVRIYQSGTITMIPLVVLLLVVMIFVVGVSDQNKHVPSMVQSKTRDLAPLDRKQANSKSKMAC